MMAKIEIVDAFMCSTCKKIFKKESDVEKCVKKHNKEKDLREKEKNIYKFISSKYINVFKNNFIPTNKNVALSRVESLGTALVVAASNLGQDLQIKSLMISEVKMGTISFKISGEMNRKAKKQNLVKSLHEHGILKRDFDKFIKKYYRINNMLNSNYNIYFSELIDVIPELKTFSGGGGNKFFYDLELNLNHFEDMQKEIEELSILRKQRNAYIDEQNRLNSEYEKERLPSVLISDIEYAIMYSNLQALEAKHQELLIELNSLSEKIKIKKQILIKNDSINIPSPGSYFRFDEERLTEISSYITNTSRIFI